MDFYTLDQNKIIDRIERSVADLEQVTALSNADYAHCLEIFEKNSNQRLEILTWLEENVLINMPASSSSILSVGCGTGAFDENIVNYLSGRVEHVKYLGIEPNQLEATEFLNRMRAQSSDQIAVDASVLVEKFGERQFSEKFDLIIFIQSIYYLDDRSDAIDTALKALNPGGVLIIAIAPDEALNTIANLIWQRQMDQKSFFTDDLEQHLDTQAIDYSKTRISASLNATSCFDSESRVGQDIIDFTVQTRTVLLPEALQQDISKFLLSISEKEGGNTYFPHPVDIFKCEKS